MTKLRWSVKLPLLILLCYIVVLLFNNLGLIGDLQKEQENLGELETSSVKQVQFWAISSEDNHNDVLIKQIVSDFNAQNDSIHINLVLNSDKYFHKINSTNIATQTNPDISIMFNSQAIQFGDRGFLFSPTSLTYDITSNKFDFISNVLTQETLYKQYVGIPLSIENYILLVRKDIFEKYSLKVPSNLNELLDALRVIRLHNMAGIALPNEGYLSYRTLLYFILVNGGALYREDGNIQLSSDKNSEIYNFIRTLSEERLISSFKPQQSITDVTSLFIKGEVAAVLTTPEMIKYIYENTSKDFVKNMGILSLKGFDNAFYSSGPMFTQVLCVYKNSARKQEAQVFANWLCKEYSNRWPQNNDSAIPALITGYTGTYISEEFYEKIFEEILPSSTCPTYPSQVSTNEIILEGSDVLNSFMQELLTSDADLTGLIAEYQNEIDILSVKLNR